MTAIAWRLDRSLQWNASHPPRLPPRPRRLPEGPGAQLFDRRIESPVGIAAGPLPNARWIEAYARLGFGLFTYGTVRTSAGPALPAPNLLHCRLGDPAVAIPAPRAADPAAVTWAVSFGRPSAAPEAWRADVARARARIRPSQLLLVSVAGTPGPEGDAEALADDYALCARWAAEAGADVVEVHLSSPSPSIAAAPPPAIFENLPLAALILDQVRRAVGQRPVVAKIGASRSPRALHELATRLAPRVDGFVLVDGLTRPVVKADGVPAFAGDGRELASIVGAAVWSTCAVQVEELLAWRKAGAWTKTILAVGGLTSVERLQAAMEAGADAAMVATAALTNPLVAARARQLR